MCFREFTLEVTGMSEIKAFWEAWAFLAQLREAS